MNDLRCGDGMKVGVLFISDYWLHRWISHFVAGALAGALPRPLLGKLQGEHVGQKAMWAFGERWGCAGAKTSTWEMQSPRTDSKQAMQLPISVGNMESIVGDNEHLHCDS